MAQITDGLRRILSSSFVYDAFQTLVGANRFRQQLVERHLKPVTGMRIIDVGCGTAAMLKHLPAGVSYFGFDLSPGYIEYAKKRFGDAGKFYCADVADAPKLGLPKADLIIATGLLHHLDDDEVTQLMRNIKKLLAPRGRFIATDGCFEPGQSPIARWFLKRDRGQNVRDRIGYLTLSEAAGVNARIELHHDLLRIPYTHSILEFYVD